MRSCFNHKNTLFGLLLVLGLFSAAAQAQSLGRDGKPLLDLPQATQPGSNCFISHGGLGCDDAQCTANVCGIDSWCCETSWDSQCASEAYELCSTIVVDNGDKAVFHVTKVFLDGNPASVTATLSCFTGLPLVQSQEISSSQGVDFIVESYADGDLDCTVSEDPVLTGYSAGYQAGVPGSDDSDGCHFADLALGADLSCIIYNEPDYVEVAVNKEWEEVGDAGNPVSPGYSLTLGCNGYIDGYDSQEHSLYFKSLYYGTSNGTNDVGYTALVIPNWEEGTNCWVNEDVFDAAVESDNGCGHIEAPNLHVELGGEDASCTITNTVFYEGVPTLGQYGMVVLALLMFGLGMVGFRRFS